MLERAGVEPHQKCKAWSFLHCSSGHVAGLEPYNMNSLKHIVSEPQKVR